MKNGKNKFKTKISILLIGFIITTYPLSTFNIEASVNDSYNSITNSSEQIPWTWTQTEVVSTESTDDSSMPSMKVDSNGNVHITWYERSSYGGSGTDDDIFYKCWNASTNSWTVTEVVSTESNESSLDPSIDTDSKGNVHIAWNDGTNYTNCGTDDDIFYKCWNASTTSWTVTEVVSTESVESSQSPSLEVDLASNIHITWDDGTNYTNCGTDDDIFYKCWNASTTSWTMTEVVSTVSNDGSYYPYIATDSALNVYIVWEDRENYTNCGTDSDIFYIKRNYSTSIWSVTEVVSTESTSASVYPKIAIDLFDSAHIVWMDSTDYLSSGTEPDIFYKRWDNQTSSWTVTEVVSAESTGQSIFEHLTTDIEGNAHVTWVDGTNILGSGPEYDIFYKYWDASTNLWTGTRLISSESTSYCGNSAIASDLAGHIHICWADSTNYTNSGDDYDIFYKIFAGPPRAPELSPILPNPTHVATVFLDWNDVPGASLYYIYRSTSNILSVESLTPIGNNVTHFYNDTLPAMGTFYYVIVANNFYGNSTLSNCWNIVYIPVVNEFGTISSLILGAFTFLTVIIVIRKKKLK